MQKATRKFGSVFPLAVAVALALSACGGGDDQRVTALEAEVAQLHNQLDAVTARVQAAQHQSRQAGRCILAVQHAAAELGKARDYLWSDRRVAPPVSNVSLSACGGLLSGSAIIDLKHQSAVMQEAVKSVETDRGGSPSSYGGTLPPPCDPNYTGYCVPIVFYDLQCADIGYNTVYVTPNGYDKHGFDGDGDGVGCE